MQATLRRLNLSPRALALAGAAIVVFLIWRRGGGDGGTGIEGPLTTIPGGTEEFPADPSGVPITIPLPPTGGIIHIPGEDPILVEPQQPQQPPAPPKKPATKPPPPLFVWGRYWRRSQLPAFYQEWRRRHKGRDTRAAWNSYLRRHSRVARYFGVPIPGRTSARAAPAPQPDPRQAAAAGSPPNTPRAMAAVPKPRATSQQGTVTTVSGARVVMPGRPLRGPRSPRRRPIVGGIAYGSGGGSPGLFYLSLAQAAAKRRRRRRALGLFR